VNKTLLTVTLACITLCATAQEMRKHTRLRWGVRAGISASVPHLNNINIDGFNVDDWQATGKSGVFTSAAMRVNFRRFFLQPEAGYSYIYGGTSFQLLQEDGEEHPDNQFVSFKNHSIDIPVFAGYNFIQHRPYVMSFYVGPQFRYNFKSSYYYNYNKVDETDEQPCKFNIAVGLSAHIGRLMLEFRYIVDPFETEVTNYNIITESGQQPTAVSYKQRINTMGFAIGYYF